MQKKGQHFIHFFKQRAALTAHIS